MPPLTRRTQSTGSVVIKRRYSNNQLESPDRVLRRSPRKHASPYDSATKSNTNNSKNKVNGSNKKKFIPLSPPSTISTKNSSGSLISNSNSNTPKKRLLADLLELNDDSQSQNQTPTKKRNNTDNNNNNNNNNNTQQRSKSVNCTPFSSPVKKRKPKLKYRPDLNTVFQLNTYVEKEEQKMSNVNNNNNNEEVIDLEMEEEKDNAYFLKYSLTSSKKIIVVSGAGISVAAGIPDFRSSSGLFESLKKESKVSNGKDLFDFNHVYSNKVETLKFNKMVCSMHNAIQKCEPTPFHNILNWLSEDDRLKRVYTQNIDGLELKLQNLNTQSPLSGKKPYPNVIQLHGSINHMSCFKCHKVYDFDPIMFGTSQNLIKYNTSTGEILDNQENDHKIVPLCPQCEELDAVRLIAGKRSTGVGKLRPRVILYNEVHPDGDTIGDIVSQDLSSKPDCLIIAGTTLKIPGVRRMCKEFAKTIRSRNGCVIWINNELPSQSIQDFLDCIDLVVVGDCQNLSKLISL